MLEWISDHRVALMWAAGTSIAAIIAIVIVVCIVMVRLPADHFRPSGQARVKRSEMRHPVRKVIMGIVGWAVLIAGIVMLALPGPGMMVILIGVMLAKFPGRDRAQQWIITRPSIFKSINWLRSCFKKPPIKAPLKGEPRPDPVIAGAATPSDIGTAHRAGPV